MNKPITPLERELFFYVMDGHQGACMPLYLMRRVAHLAKEQDFIATLRWLKRSRIVGSEFIHWFNQKGGAVNAMAAARQEILRDLQVRSVFAREMV